MKVRFAFNFNETELRSIRASIGRSGVATRKECHIFVDRALRTALDKAPQPKASRVTREKPMPDTRTVESDGEEHDRLRAQRDRIARSYGHGVPPYSVRKALREATLAVGREEVARG